MSVTIETSDVITTNPKVMHGTPCFDGTRVPIKVLFDHIEADYSVEEFLEQFPNVTREQVMAFLKEAAAVADHAARPKAT